METPRGQHRGKEHITTNEKLAWIAGVVDGEGCIAIYKFGDRGSTRTCLTVANTDVRLIEKLSEYYTELFGLRTVVSVKHQNENRPCYDLSVYRREEVKLILEALLPYLVSKGDQAKALIDYMNAYPKYARANDKAQLGIINELKRLKRIIIPPVETKRVTPAMGEAIVRAV